jgi:hypothetical protein
MAKRSDATLQRIGAQSTLSAARLRSTLDTLAAIDSVIHRSAALQAQAVKNATRGAVAIQEAVEALQRDVSPTATRITDLRDDVLRVATSAVALRSPGAVDQLNEYLDRATRAYGAGSNVVAQITKLRDGHVQLQTGTIGYLQQAQSLVSGAGSLVNALPLPARTVAKISGALNTASKLAGLGMNLASGNILGVIGSIGGLFGGGGPSEAEVFHQEVMAELGKINERLDQLESLQRQTLAKLDVMDQKLDSLSVQLARSHAEVIAKLDSINQNVLWSVKVAVDLDVTQFDHCATIAKGFEDNKSWPDRKNFTEGIGGTPIAACRTMLDNLAVVPDPTSPKTYRLLWLSVWQGNNQDVQRRLKQVAAPTFKYLNDVWLPSICPTELKDLTCLRSAVALRARNAFGVPSFSYDDLVSKLLKVTRPTTEKENLANIPLEIMSADNMLHDSITVLFAQRAISLHTVWPFLTQNSALKDGSEYFDPTKWPLESRNSEGIKTLTGALRATTFALAQESVLSGDLLLPALADALEAEEAGDTTVSWLVSQNATLAINIARFSIYRATITNKVSSSAYAKALAAGDANALANLLSHTIFPKGAADPTYAKNAAYHLSFENGAMLLQVGNLKVPVPDITEFEARALVPSMAQQRLHVVQALIAQTLAEYSAAKSLSQADRNSISLLLALP